MAKAAQKVDPLGALADELGELDQKLAPKLAVLKPDMARAEKIRKLLREAYDAKPAWTAHNVVGKTWTVQLDAKGPQDVVNVVKLAKLITPQALWRLVSCTLKALRESDVNPEVIAQVIETHETGSRGISIIPTLKKAA